ncbi:MAG: hypothetical protein FGM41_02920 [Bacteroidetes bacterium]|nr:hypothetical protein [Bacteroidota bacterium]
MPSLARTANFSGNRAQFLGYKIGYRFSFNGQEKETELNPSITSAEYWMYDGRLGRRWNVDPVRKPERSSYDAFDNKPIVKIDPNGDDDYYNRKGLYIGSFGDDNGVMRVVDSEDEFKKAQITNIHGGREIVISDDIRTNALFIANATFSTGKEHVMIIIFDPDKALIYSEIDPEGTGTSDRCYPPEKKSYDASHKGKVLIGTLHGHPLLDEKSTKTRIENGQIIKRTEHTTNKSSVSDGDLETAENDKIPGYAVDAWDIEMVDVVTGGIGAVHRANPNRTPTNNICTLRQIGTKNGNFNLGKDALEQSGGCNY